MSSFVTGQIIEARCTRCKDVTGHVVMACLDGVPVIVRTLKSFELANSIREVVIAARQEDIPQMYALIRDYEITKVRQIVTGGETRQESVFPNRAGASRSAQEIRTSGVRGRSSRRKTTA